VFDRIERKLEGVVSDGFARAFKGDVQPVEIAARLQRELDAEARLLSRDRKLVPNDFTVRLSTHDYDNLFPYSGPITAEIVPQLREHAGTAGYIFNGPITIEYVLDESLPTGRFTVASAAVAGVVTATAVSETAIRRSPLVLEVNGVRHPLVPPGLVIGRGSEADLRINDPGISRRHAQIIVVGAGDALTARIEDLGSTNGITVNGRKVTSAALDEGTKIEIGSTRMLVHSPAGV